MIEDMEGLRTSEADRQELHALVDHIPAGDLPAARKILRALADPVWQSIVSNRPPPAALNRPNRPL